MEDVGSCVTAYGEFQNVLLNEEGVGVGEDLNGDGEVRNVNWWVLLIRQPEPGDGLTENVDKSKFY